LYLAGIAWTLFYDTIYAHQDIEDDALIGVKSTARLFADNTPRWLFLFQVVAMLLMLFAVITPQAMAQLFTNPLQLLLVLAGIWAFGAHLTMQLRKLDIHDATTCMHLFRSNREAGLIPVVFWAFAVLLQ
jgi:4-hydroxybenzoate polyprenyltransferase